MSAPTAILAQSIWQNTGTDYNTAANWSAGVPSGNNVAAFNTAASSQPNLSTLVSIAGFAFTTTSAFGYDITRTGSATFTLTGQTNGSAAQTTNSNSAAIFAANTSGTNTFDVPLILAPAAGVISAFNQAAGGTLVVNGVVSGAGITLNLPGAGMVQLNGVNTYSGGTTINGGTLQIGNDGALGTGTVTMNAGTGVLEASGASHTISNAVVWAANGTISGANNLLMNGSFTSSGAASRSITVNNNTTLGGNVFLAESDTARGLTVAGSGSLTINGVITNNAAANTVASALTLNSATVMLTLNGTNTYTGPTTLSAGTLVLGNKSAFGTGNVAWNGVSTSANTDLSGANAIANTVSFGATGNVYTGSNNIQLSGTLTNNVTGTDTVTNNISGGTLILSGIVNLSNNATGKTLAFNGSGNTNITGVIANGGGSTSSLAYSGSGRLTLTNANTYSGGTSVTGGGTLLVSNTTGSGTGTNTVIVNGSGTTLGGTGTISGSVTVGNTSMGATLNPGPKGTNATAASVGTLTTGALTLGPNANTFHVDAFGTTTTAWDKLVSTGAIALGSGTTTLDVAIASSLNFTNGTIYTLLSGTSLTGTFSGITDGDAVTFDGYQFTADYTATGFDLVAVPEPSTWIGGALAVGVIGWSVVRKTLKAEISKS